MCAYWGGSSQTEAVIPMRTQPEDNLTVASKPSPTSAAGNPGVALVVSPKRARAMLDCSHTKIYELINSGAIESYLDGASRKIIVASINEYISRKLAASKTA
jgi:hypothetical protein